MSIAITERKTRKLQTEFRVWMSALVSWKEEYLKSVAKTPNFSIMGSLRFAHAFKTLEVNPGRNVGKTHYILDNITKNDLLIVYSYDLINNITRSLREQFDKENIDIRNIHDRNLYNGVPNNFNKVYIDDPRLVFERKDRDLFIERMTTENPLQMFIFLGE